MNNKQENEIKAEIVVLERYAKETKGRLESLHQRLTEAEKLEKLDKLLEKPKLRHGDFGYNNLGYPRLILQSKNEELFDAGVLYCDAVSDGYAHPLPDPILGNVFDLMKDWVKPFKEYGADKYATGIKIDEDNGTIRMYACVGSDCRKEKHFAPFFLNEAEEIYNALGHAIAELKQKQMNKEISGEKER